MNLALIHTSPTMIPVFKPLLAELLPGVAAFNLVDESLLRDIQHHGRLVPTTARRLVGHVLSAVDAGADHVLVTCSSMGPAVELSRSLCTATVLRVDEAMATDAVRAGRRVGVIATLPSTLHPTVDLVRRTAATLGEPVDVRAVVVENAFAAVISGDGATHDRLVLQQLTTLAAEVDVVVLAQASMARVADAMPPDDRKTPILSSPRPAVGYLAQLHAKRGTL